MPVATSPDKGVYKISRRFLRIGSARNGNRNKQDQYGLLHDGNGNKYGLNARNLKRIKM
jgi:hypothetical protein